MPGFLQRRAALLSAEAVINQIAPLVSPPLAARQPFEFQQTLPPVDYIPKRRL